MDKYARLLPLLLLGILTLGLDSAAAGTIVKSKSNITNNRVSGTGDMATPGSPAGIADQACRGDAAPACEAPKISACHGGKWICVSPATAQH